jgi:hypothetical protein
MNPRDRRALPMRRLAAIVLLQCGAISGAAAQQPLPGVAACEFIDALDATAGSTAERSVLILQLASNARSSGGVAPLGDSSTQARLQEACGTARRMAARSNGFILRQLRVSLWINTDRAKPEADGAVWQGRGATAALTGGFMFRSRRWSVAVRPIGFATENRAFLPMGGNIAATSDFRHPVLGEEIDLPYRFGDRARLAMDPGESWLRLDASHFGAGISSASQRWGPAHYYPLVLGTEAAGFPRLFGEARDIPLWIGQLSAHWVVGRLEASPGKVLQGGRSRMVTALTSTFRPGAFPGLEVGASRFFHVRWAPGVVAARVLALPLKGLLKAANPTGETSENDYNQLASLFARVAPPRSPIEIYGELYKEDHNLNLRDLAVEPDHATAFVVGLRHARKRGTTTDAFTIEGVNGLNSHLIRVRQQGPIYTHGAVREGHTFRGQAVGSQAVTGGGGYTIAWHRIGMQHAYWAEAELQRTAQKEEGGSFLNTRSGFYSLRLGREVALAGRRTSTLVGIEPGFGLQRGRNFVLQVSTNVSP